MIHVFHRCAYVHTSLVAHSNATGDAISAIPPSLARCPSQEGNSSAKLLAQERKSAIGLSLLGNQGTGREIVLEEVSRKPFTALQCTREELKGDPEIVMKAVSLDGHALEYASEELKGDPEIVMKAVSQAGFALQHATEELKGDPEIVMKAVSENGRALKFATEELKGDPEIVMKAVSENGHALEHASEELKGDPEIVMKAVSQDGFALQHATEELKGDPEIVMTAVSQAGLALPYATEELKGNPEIVMKAVSQNGLALRDATEDMKGDEKIMRRALEQSPQELVGLHVVLLSGRGCHDILPFGHYHRIYVLRHCADRLDLDPADVQRRGVLMNGLIEVQDLDELEPGKLHEITLVLS